MGHQKQNLTFATAQQESPFKLSIITSRQFNPMQTKDPRHKNKPTDFKRLLQEACKTPKPQVPHPLLTSLNRSKGIPYDSQHDPTQPKEKTSHPNSLLSQLRELNSKNGLATASLKNKENCCVNKNTFKQSNKLIQSTDSLYNSPNQIIKNMPRINMKTVGEDMEIPRAAKMSNKNMNVVRTSRDRKGFRLEPCLDVFRAPPATSREKRPAESPRRVSGLKITDFSLGRKLGKGKFGQVRLAQDKSTKFLLAIKTINIQQLKDSGMESQLISEVKLQMFCKHPNILKMYGCMTDRKNIYLLLELGSSCLFNELRSEKCFSEEKTAYLVKQMIDSLRFLHSESIIHRDIKPQNIMITEDVLKLSDFGWSIYSPLLKRQTFCGTLDYVSPEVVNGEQYDEKVDVWSLGVLCYQLCFGNAPFEDPNNTQQGTYTKILQGDLKFPTCVSVQLKDLISKILLKNPSERLSLSQIEAHPWLQKHKSVGRYIAKEVWDGWEGLTE